MQGWNKEKDPFTFFLIRKIKESFIDNTFCNNCEDGKHVYEKEKIQSMESWSLLNPTGKVENSIDYGQSAIYGEGPVYFVCMSVLSGPGHQLQREFVVMSLKDLNVIVKRHSDEDKYRQFLAAPKIAAFNQQKQ